MELNLKTVESILELLLSELVTNLATKQKRLLSYEIEISYIYTVESVLDI